VARRHNAEKGKEAEEKEEKKAEAM